MALLMSAASVGAGGILWLVSAMRKGTADLGKAGPLTTDGMVEPNIVTYIYEWAWGTSIHCSPSVPGKSRQEAARLHEERVADLIGARPGQRILDVGCGIGGPMRAISRKSGANTVGITINGYQVSRARAYNSKAGLAHLCEVVRGNFLQLPFDDGSFDGAYSIEGACCAADLEGPYAEVFRVLKPGGMFASYEWVTTEVYEEAKDHRPELVEAVTKLAGVNGLPRFRAFHEIAETARRVGFEVVEERDLAKPPAGPWWPALKLGGVSYWMDHLMFSVMASLTIVPKSVVSVHEGMREMALHYHEAGETRVVSPMHMVLCRKPSP